MLHKFVISLIAVIDKPLFALWRLGGWDYDRQMPDMDKFMLVMAPHTTFRDYFHSIPVAIHERRRPRIMMKQELLNYPILGWFFKLGGGFGVDRKKSQNTVEQAGTYPLPEAQLDRFLMFIRVGYPSEQDEIEILKRTTGNDHKELKAMLSADDIIALQNLVRSVTVSDELLAYAANLTRATRPDHIFSDNKANEQRSEQSQSVIEHVRWGAGPRAGQALILCAKARALMARRYAITIADIQFVAPAVLRHRVLVNFQAEALNITPDNVINDLLAFVSVPTSPLQ